MSSKKILNRLRKLPILLFASGMTESMSTESRIVLDSPVMAGKFGAFLDLFSILNSI